MNFCRPTSPITTWGVCFPQSIYMFFGKLNQSNCVCVTWRNVALGFWILSEQSCMFSNKVVDYLHISQTPCLFTILCPLFTRLTQHPSNIYRSSYSLQMQFKNPATFPINSSITVLYQLVHTSPAAGPKRCAPVHPFLSRQLRNFWVKGPYPHGRLGQFLIRAWWLGSLHVKDCTLVSFARPRLPLGLTGLLCASSSTLAKGFAERTLWFGRLAFGGAVSSSFFFCTR